MLRSAKNFFLDLIFPSLCLACEGYLGNSDKKCCDSCLHSLPAYDYLVCPVCLKRVVADRCHPEYPYLLVAATSYIHPVAQKIIWQFKYGGWQSLAEPLADLMAEGLKNSGDYKRGEWLVAPVPLHKSRQNHRGFNQAELLAGIVNKKLGLAWSKNNLIRVKNTESQAELSDWKAREENVKNSFFINKPEEFFGKGVILIDDVFTSGATLCEAARTLKLSGAKKIIALTFARAR